MSVGTITGEQIKLGGSNFARNSLSTVARHLLILMTVGAKEVLRPARMPSKRQVYRSSAGGSEMKKDTGGL